MIEPGFIIYVYIYIYMAVCQNLVPLVNIKIAGKWMFIPLELIINRFWPTPIYVCVCTVYKRPPTKSGQPSPSPGRAFQLVPQAMGGGVELKLVHHPLTPGDAGNVVWFMARLQDEETIGNHRKMVISPRNKCDLMGFRAELSWRT